MSVEDLQDCSCAVRGCVVKSSFVHFLYLSKALFMMSWKAEEAVA